MDSWRERERERERTRKKQNKNRVFLVPEWLTRSHWKPCFNISDLVGSWRSLTSSTYENSNRSIERKEGLERVTVKWSNLVLCKFEEVGMYGSWWERRKNEKSKEIMMMLWRMMMMMMMILLALCHSFCCFFLFRGVGER